MSLVTESSRGMTPWRSQMPAFMIRRPPPRALTPPPPPPLDDDPTCPDCKGECVDAHGFDCTRCAGEGVVDE